MYTCYDYVCVLKADCNERIEFEYIGMLMFSNACPRARTRYRYSFAIVREERTYTCIMNFIIAVHVHTIACKHTRALDLTLYTVMYMQVRAYSYTFTMTSDLAIISSISIRAPAT